MKITQTILLTLAVLLIVTGCSNPIVDLEPQNSGTTLELSLGSWTRTIAPADAAQYTPVSFKVNGLHSGGESFGPVDANSGVYTNSNILPGDWTITVQGYNNGGHQVAEKVLTLTLAPKSTTRQNVILDRLPGQGTLSLTIHWLAANEYDVIEGQLKNLATEEVSALSMSVESHNGTLDKALTAGNYTLNLSLKKNGTVLETLTEAVRIYQDCTSVASFNRIINTPPISMAYDPANPVFTVEFSGATSRAVSLTDVPAGKQVYLVKVNHNTAAVPSDSTGAIASVAHVPYTSPLLERNSSQSPGSTTAWKKMDHEGATKFNALPPLTSSSSARGLPGVNKVQSTVSYGASSPLTLDVSSKSFWVENASGEWIQISATLRALGQYSYVWVADANYDDASSLDNDNKITKSQALALQTKFDGDSALDYRNGIFKNVTGIFGYENGGGPGGDGGRDADQHVSILVYDIGYDFTAEQNGGVTGYFWGKDHYSQEDLDGALGPGVIKTNNLETFYIDAHFTDLAPGMIIGTLAHEYQHMIHFSVKGLTQGAQSPTWFDEMCAMNAEDLVMANLGLNPVVDGAQNRLPEFLYHYGESGVSDWLAEADVLKSYASAFTFGAFLSRTYGGASFFKALMEAPATSAAAIEIAIQSTQDLHDFDSDTFPDVLNRYAQAHLYHDVVPGINIATLKKADTKTISDISYTATEIDLSSIRQYDMGTGTLRADTGIRTYLPSTRIPLRPWGTSVHTQASWTNLVGGTLELNLSAPVPGVEYIIMIK